MPQMSPMWWTMLFIVFIISIIITMTFLYFNSKLQLNYQMKNYKQNLNWKW